MGTWTVPTWIWPLLLGLLLFVEVIALRNSYPGDTMSEFLWGVFGMNNPDDPAGRWRRVLLLFLMVWLTVHFLTRGRF